MDVTEPPLSWPALGVFWADFSQLTNAIGDVRNFEAETQYGISVWRLRLTRTADEITFSYTPANTNLLELAITEDGFSNHYEKVLYTWCILGAGRNYESYEDLLADGYTFLNPKRLVLDIWLADINDCSTYNDNVAAANSVALGYSLGGFTMMDDEDPPAGGGGDPCSITNLMQPFFVTGITTATNQAISISFQSCQTFRYLISYANSLSNNESWIPLTYIWGATNVSSTTWTDPSTTNDDGSTITQRFYRVERLLGLPIAAGGESSVAIKQDGTLWAWGNSDGNLGDGLDSAITGPDFHYVELYLPYPSDVAKAAACGIQAVTNATAVAAGGDDYTVIVDATGTMWAFGENGEGQLGNGMGPDNSLHPIPMPISGISNVVSVAAWLSAYVGLTR